MIGRQRTNYPLIGSFNLEQDPNIDSERTINLYQITDPLSKRGDNLVPTAGRKTVLSFPAGDNTRASFLFNGFLYVVVQDTLYEVDTSYNYSVIGTLETNSGYVGINANQHQLMLVDGVNGYIYDGSLFTTLPIDNTNGFQSQPIDLAYIDGYFIVPKGGTNQFFLSNLNDGTTWQAGINNAAITTVPDVFVAARALRGYLFLFGQRSMEIWYDSGDPTDPNQPFRRINELSSTYGCAAVGSVVTGFDKLFFLSSNDNGVGSVMMVDGVQITPVSTTAVDFQLQSYSNVADAQAVIYKLNGHIFYEISFTEADHTFVYDVTTNKWFEKQELDGSRSLISTHTFFGNKHIVGGYVGHSLYELSNDYYSNDEDPIPRIRIGNHFTDVTNNMIKINQFTVVAAQGVGTPTGYDADPTIFLAWSNDGGQTFGNEHRASIGRIGERTYRTTWYNCGYARDWVPRITFYNAVKFIVLGATIDYEVLKN